MKKRILTTLAIAIATTFAHAAEPEGVIGLVPEAKGFQTVYELDPSKPQSTKGEVNYAVDNSAQVNGEIERIAYFMMLNDKDYVFVAMDAFTQDLKQVGVPTKGSGARFQTNVANLLVKSNVEGVENGSFETGGNIEFWDCNYAPKNAAKVPEADEGKFDLGDVMSTEASPGYGSMQVHNHGAKQTIFAFNNWKANSNADLGIGNQGKGNPDWTFSKNASGYTAAKLVVLVKTK